MATRSGWLNETEIEIKKIQRKMADLLFGLSLQGEIFIFIKFGIGSSIISGNVTGGKRFCHIRTN